MKISFKSKYSGQVLAVVLVVMVVGVIIALSLIQRSGSGEILVKEEDFSASALEIADTGLDGVAVLGVDFATIPANTLCKDISDNIPIGQLAEPCIIELDNIPNTVMEESVREVIKSQLSSECSVEGSSSNSYFRLVLDNVGMEDEKTIGKDSSISLVFNSPNNPSCSVNVTPTGPTSSAPVGIIASAVYAQTDASKNITAYRPYTPGTGDQTIVAHCLTAECLTGWGASGGDWKAVPTPSFSVPVGLDGFFLNELRLRAVGADVSFRYTLTGDCSGVSAGNIFRVSAQAYCGTQFRGLEYLVTEESSAPAIFDYVLFNGDGALNLGTN